MSDFTAVVRRISRHIADPRRRRDIEDELLDHLEAAALAFHAQGLSLEEATDAAVRQLGDADQIVRELGRLHIGIKFRYFAVGGLLWYVAGAIIFETHVIFPAPGWLSPLPYWLVQLPFQVIGLPHWLALQSPQIRGLTVLDPLARFLDKSFHISPWHVDGFIGVVILIGAVYGAYRLARWIGSRFMPLHTVRTIR